MTEWHRFLLGLAAASVYAGLISMKFMQAEKAGITDKKTRWRMINFDVIRLLVDGGLLAGFLVSPLCSVWFGLFPGTALGYCAGCVALISATLLVSVFVDWIPVRRCYRDAGGQAPPFSRFLLRQFVHVFQIVFALALVWCVFLFLEPMGTSLWVKIAAAAGALLLLRVILQVLRGHRKKRLNNGTNESE